MRNNNVPEANLTTIRQTLLRVENNQDEFRNQLNQLSYDEISELKEDVLFLNEVSRTSERIINVVHARKRNEAEEQRKVRDAAVVGAISGAIIVGVAASAVAGLSGLSWGYTALAGAGGASAGAGVGGVAAAAHERGIWAERRRAHMAAQAQVAAPPAVAAPQAGAH